jgi:hypothetical protein
MSEWWTYRLSSFLMFSPKTYWRNIELFNTEFWPLHLVALAMGLVLLALAAQQRLAAFRAQAVLLAALWAWVAWAFHWQHYAGINWAARYYAEAYAAQSALLLLVGLLARETYRSNAGAMRRKLGWCLFASGLFFYPLFGLFAGHPLAQIELFGMTPEPTALGTLGLILINAQPLTGRLRCLLALIPVLSLLVGAATLWLVV